MSVKLKWNARRLERDLQSHLIKVMTKIVLYLEGETKQLISRGNRTGTNPSKPNEPPKVRTGTLRANVGHEVRTIRGTVTGIFGVRKGLANKYAPLLEHKGIRDGTVRPFLRPTLFKNRVRILKMLS